MHIDMYGMVWYGMVIYRCIATMDLSVPCKCTPSFTTPFVPFLYRSV